MALIKANSQCANTTSITITPSSSGGLVVWAATPTATLYSVSVFTHPANVWTGYNVVTAATTVTITSLSPSTQYRFQIASICPGSTSTGADAIFTTTSNRIVYTPMTAIGYSFKYMKVDSLFHLSMGDTSLKRGDTRAGAIVFKTSDSLFYGYNGLKWNALGGGSGTVTSVATGLGLSGGTITSTGTLLVDTSSASILSRKRADAKYFVLPSLKSGSVLFSNGTTIVQDTTNIFWDNTNKRLGIRNNSPGYVLDVRAISRIDGGVVSTGSDLSLLTTTSNSINFLTNGVERARFHSSTGGLFLGTSTNSGYRLDVRGGTVYFEQKVTQPTSSNSPKGTATLVSGVVTISNTLATTGCFIQVNYRTGTALSGSSSVLVVSSLINSTSFTVTAYNAGATTTNTSDNNTIEYTISN